MKILIIDDEPQTVELLRQGLEAKLFLVDSALDGERGAFMAKTGSYDLVILDYVLPKLSGPEVIKEIKADKPGIPIIMLTVRSEFKDKAEMFSLGADDYLTKPFLFDELLLHIQAVLKRPAQIAAEAIKVDNLCLDLISKTVRRGGQEIYLTRREFCLLELLMRQKGKIVSRQEILEQVWDYNADPFSNSIETHIASLRRKLNISRYRNLIHTFTGRGYKLDSKKLGA